MWYLINSILARFNLEVIQNGSDKMLPETNQIICRGCDRVVLYTRENTTIFWWTDYTWYSLATTECYDCTLKQGWFIFERLDWELQWAKDNGLDIVVLSGLPPPHIITAFHRTYPELVEFHEITQAEESEIKFFGYLLKTIKDTNWFK